MAKKLQTVTSWAATAHQVAEAWTHHSVPTVYATQTLQKSQEELQQNIDSLTQLNGAKQFPSLPGQLRQIQQTVHQLSETISHDDPAAVDQQIQQLSQQEQKLRAIVDRLKESP